MTAHYKPLARGGPATPLAQVSGTYRRWAKRGLDLAVVLAAAPFVLLVLLPLALLVARDHGPVFFRQTRLGRGAQPYGMWKLRTMVPDAEARLETHLAQDPCARAEWDSTQKLRRDPRITRFGHLLRKTSMDELPQLWNVLVGDMSLVGPRPMLPQQASLYSGKAYFRLRPGITGSWQVSQRNLGGFAARAGYDTAYERDLSLREDLRILQATVRVVLHGTGC